MPKTIVMSLGGSLIVPDDIDTSFLKNFKKIIQKYVNKGFRFVIICGGGSTARKYQGAVNKITKSSEDKKDWVGISATYLNAFLLTIIFEKNADKNIITDPTKKVMFSKPIRIASGWKPGWSTDFDAVLIAKKLKLRSVINMSNVNYVYDKDPKKSKSAKKFTELTWKEYRKISGSGWSAGLSLPFDPIAAKQAQKDKLSVSIIGSNINNFKKLIDRKKFKGTILHP